MKTIIILSLLGAGCGCHYDRAKIARALKGCMAENNFDRSALTECKDYSNSMGYVCDSQ